MTIGGVAAVAVADYEVRQLSNIDTLTGRVDGHDGRLDGIDGQISALSTRGKFLSLRFASLQER